jgi:fermentation-respiration switch protein FrsA (DUF1100 family)
MITTLTTILVLCAAAYGLIMLYAWWFAESHVFRPHEPGYGEGPQVVRIRARDGVPLAAVHLEAPGAACTVLHLHGNAEDLGDMIPRLEAMRANGFSVLAFDYRGYGLTPGKPDERNVLADTTDVFRHLTGPMGIAPERVIVHGFSLGGGPAAALAAREPLGGLVLEGTFTSAFRVATEVRVLPWDYFPVLEQLERVRCPVLVVHGTCDETIPFRHGRRLFAAARPPKEHLWVEGAGHNDLVEVAGERYWAALRALAARVAAAGEAS